MKPAAVLALIAFSTLSVSAQNSTPTPTASGLDGHNSISSAASAINSAANSMINGLSPSAVRESLSKELAAITGAKNSPTPPADGSSKEGAASLSVMTNKMTVGIAVVFSISFAAAVGILA